jgi:hypothetical protein
MAEGKDILPRALLAPIRLQIEMLQEVVERERKLRAEVFGRLLDPMDSVLDLLEESGKTFRAQADALAEASAALQQTATLMQTQAEIYESTIRALREPAALARRVSGAKPRPRGGGGGRKPAAKKKS